MLVRTPKRSPYGGQLRTLDRIRALKAVWVNMEGVACFRVEDSGAEGVGFVCGRWFDAAAISP